MDLKWIFLGLMLVVTHVDSAGATSWIRLKSLDSRFVSYVHADPLGAWNGMAEGHLVLEGRKALANGSRAFVSASVWGDNRSLSSGVVDQFHDRSARRPNFNADEAYIDFYSDQIDLRIGKQKISWGKSDGLNPTDVFGAFDYADLLNPERLGIVGIRAFVYADRTRGDQSIEFVCLPLYSPSRAGRVTTRWRPLLEDGSPAAGIDIQFPKNTPANADYGIKISRHLREWDMSVMYARTIDDVAGGERIAGPLVRPLFLKKRMVGVDASRIINEGRWETHIEAAYTSTPSGNDDDFVQLVAGGRRTFVDVYQSVDLDLTLEWAGEHVYSRRRNPSVIVQNLIQRPFPGAVLADAKWELTDFVTWKIKAAWIYRGLDAYVITNDFSWRVSDLLEVTAGFDALSGKGTRATQAAYEENDRWRIESKIFFR